jgi:hypothetical protein
LSITPSRLMNSCTWMAPTPHLQSSMTQRRQRQSRLALPQDGQMRRCLGSSAPFPSPAYIIRNTAPVVTSKATSE